LQRSIGLLDCRRDFRTRLEIALVPRHGLGAAWRPDDSTPRGRLLRCGSSTSLMSAQGHPRPRRVKATPRRLSALPPKADIRFTRGRVCLVPKADSCTAAR
jgi:hypothetical protein